MDHTRRLTVAIGQDAAERLTDLARGSLRRRGVLLAPDGDGRLSYHPRNALSEAERTVLARHRDAILALFDADPVGWRTAVMAAQVAQSGAIPLLLARPGVSFPRGSCCSCGGPLSTDAQYRCGPCVAAAIAVLERVP